jgi:hypothetical protein
MRDEALARNDVRESSLTQIAVGAIPTPVTKTMSGTNLATVASS